MSGPERFFSNCSRLGESDPDSLYVVLDQRGLFPNSLYFLFPDPLQDVHVLDQTQLWLANLR